MSGPGGGAGEKILIKKNFGGPRAVGQIRFLPMTGLDVKLMSKFISRRKMLLDGTRTGLVFFVGYGRQPNFLAKK